MESISVKKIINENIFKFCKIIIKKIYSFNLIKFIIKNN